MEFETQQENVHIQKLLSSRPLKVLNKGVWKGDLNSTIQHLFAHKEDLENLN